MKGKKALLVSLAIFAVLFVSSTAHAQEVDVESEIARQIGQIKGGRWNQELNNLPDEMKDVFGGKNFSQIVAEFATGTDGVDDAALIKDFLKAAQKELAQKLRFVTALLAMAVIGGIAAQLHGTFKLGTGDAAGFVCFAMSILIAVYLFADTVAQAKVAVDTAGRIMEIAFPPMLALLAASGGIASAGVFQPATAILSGATTAVLGKVALPMTLAMGVISVVGNLSKRMTLSRMQALLKTVLKWMLGIMSTLFVGFGAIRGIMAKGMDGVSLRAARFALDRFIPYVGSLMSGSVDTVLGCSVLVKNAVGLCAVLLMAAALAMPLMRIAASQIALRIAAALIEPFGDPQLTKSLGELADVLSYLFAIVAVAGLMFALLAALIMGAGGILT